MRQTELHLSDEDRDIIDGIRSKGQNNSCEVNRAHTVSCLDRGIPEAQSMYDLLALYAKPLCRNEPVICIDEKSLQLVGHSRQPLPIAPGCPAQRGLRVHPQRNDQPVRRS